MNFIICYIVLECSAFTVTWHDYGTEFFTTLMKYECLQHEIFLNIIYSCSQFWNTSNKSLSYFARQKSTQTNNTTTRLLENFDNIRCDDNTGTTFKICSCDFEEIRTPHSNFLGFFAAYIINSHFYVLKKHVKSV